MSGWVVDEVENDDDDDEETGSEFVREKEQGER